MPAHQPTPTPDGRGIAALAAAGRAADEARETPTMDELLAACAAASAVSTPPDAADEARSDAAGQDCETREPDESDGADGAGSGPLSTGGRDAA
ncbi:hypothetical protein Stsp01_42340 [Streptomyces sp. NBRC 13847]|uniref:hypothetical protein n=1 Tax=Streptomyces TaxID=1883 RepID=UPI00249FFC48|nr:hypothetical protein [Streptomyces sp. NBRC 13847]GLW17491.1 hypothetical protein Stsp01_42340 [Streptomyces sp. NBRC 13847]